MAEHEHRKRSLIGRILVLLLALMALAGLVAMALSIINPYMNPKDFIWTTVFGLAFWEIFLFNALVLLLLILFRSRWAWVSVVALVISIPGVSKSFAFGFKSKAENSFKVMSYNVHYFSDIDTILSKEEFADKVVELVREETPDVLCCQEFIHFKPKLSRAQCIKDFADSIQLPYIYYNEKKNYGGNVVFSKYPLTKVSEESGFGQENTYGVMVLVDAGEKGKFHVANVHLLSFAITNNEIDVLTKAPERQNNLDTIGKSVLHKLNDAFQRRSDELEKVLVDMQFFDGPIIVCGDFNETPMSYVHRQMRKAGFVDTFTKVGRGIAPTYAGRLPLLRIDYIWANNQIKPLNFKRERFKASDHYPVLLEFSLQQ